MTTLTSPAITELTSESGPLNLLGEWLRGWFNGSLHALSSVQSPTLFPAVNLTFGESTPVQPLYQLGQGIDTQIVVVMQPRQEVAEHLDTALAAGKLATDRLILFFYIKSSHPGPGMKQQSAQKISELLKSLLVNPESRFPLAAGGLRILGARPAQVSPSEDYGQRLVVADALAQYPILFGDQPPVPDGTALLPPVGTGWPQSIEFFQPLGLVAGEYLMGTFTAYCRMLLTSARLTVFAPQGAPLVLQMEVAAVATNRQITVEPNAVPRTEVTTVLDLGNLTVTTGQVVRWKVISAPDGADLATGATLEMSGTPLA